MSKRSFNEFSRKLSINYGLERLNLHIEKNAMQQDKTFYENKQMPGMEILEKFLPFNRHSFPFKWAVLLFITNIYNCFTVAYFIGFVGFPKGTWLALESGFEVVLIVDLFLRALLRNCSGYKQMWFIHEDSSIFAGICLFFSSLPYSMLCLAYSHNLEHWGVALIRLPKLLRGGSILKFFTNMKIITRNKGWVYVDLFKYLLFGLITTHFSAMLFLLVDRIQTNPEDTGKSYEETWKEKEFDSFEIFMDIEFWALGSLASITISYIIPLSLLQNTVCVIFMILGNTLFGSVFTAMTYKLNRKNERNLISKEKYQLAKYWTSKRKLPDDLKVRVLNFYNIAHDRFNETSQFRILDELPLSLKTEIAMYLYKDLIPKVKLFELGEPSFIMGFVRHLKPKLFMAEDFIVRKGDLAKEFFLVNVGSVEVLTADDSTTICILEQGGYFGEIGIILNICRTVSVRATIATILTSISREHLLSLLKSFPEHFQYLKKVAEQRLKTTSSSDIDRNYDIIEEYSDFGSSSSGESECDFYAPAQHCEKNWIEKIITVAESKAIPYRYFIDPFSYFYYFWISLLLLSNVFYLYYIPFAIAFLDRGGPVLMILDGCSFGVFVLDVWVSLHSAIFTKFGNFVHDSHEIRKDYFNRFFFLDMLSIIPSDLFAYVFNLHLYVIISSKVLRLFKLKRMFQVIRQIRYRHSMLRFSFFAYIPVIFYFSHLAACFFMLTCRLQYRYYQLIENMRPCYLNEYQKNHDFSFLDLPINTQYIEMWFFTSSIFSSNTYNIVIPTSPCEKIFGMILLIISRSFIAFLLAESSSFRGLENSLYISEKAKLSIYKEWVSQHQLPTSLKNRITNHNRLVWHKLRGYEDSEIIKDLPESLQVDINCYLFKSLIQSGLFPSHEEGSIREIIKKCQICIQCAGEVILQEGELGFEMFFILDGEVEVRSSSSFFTVIGKGNVFGEMALINNVPCVRNATVVAASDVTLAVLNSEDFYEVSRVFPEFCKSLRVQAAKREEINQRDSLTCSIFLNPQGKTQNFKNILDQSVVNHTEIRENFRNSYDIALDIQVRASFLDKFLRFYQSRYSVLPQLGMGLCIIIYCPLYIAFKLSSTATLVLQMLSSLIFFLYSLYYFYIYVLLQRLNEEAIENIFHDSAPSFPLLRVAHHLILSLPLELIFESFPRSGWLNLLYLLIRVSFYPYLFEYIASLKERLELIHIVKTFESIFHFILTSHILACIYIELADWEEQNWIVFTAKQPGKFNSQSSVYIYSAYWAFSCLSHASLGDIISQSNTEKVFNSLVCILGCFLYAFLFGNICSLVFGFSSKLRSRLYTSYIFVNDFIKKKRVENLFKRQVSNYLNFLWRANKRVIDREILKQLPLSIATDVQIFKYSLAVNNSFIFKDQFNKVNYPLIKSIFRLMEIQFYLPADNIVRITDKSSDLFIILDGEVDVIHLKADRIINSLRSGDHFGEVNFLLKTGIRSASVIATSISEIGVISKIHFEKLSQAFEDWSSKLLTLATDRLKHSFSVDSLERVHEKLSKYENSFNNDPEAVQVYMKRAEKLVTEKLISKEKKINKNQWDWLNFIHLAFIIYSVFSIPVEIALDYPVQSYLLYLESLVVIESCGFFLLTCRLTLLLRMKPESDSQELLKLFYKNYVIHDFLACSPFNVLFPVLGIVKPVALIYLLRMVRLVSVFRLPSLIHKFELYFKEFSDVIGALKAIFFMSVLMHWFSCLWFFSVEAQEETNSWKVKENLDNNAQSSHKWVKSIYFVMNVTTGTGFSDSWPVTIVEICLTMLLILVGNILFAIAFGLLSSISQSIKPKTDSLLEKFSSVFSLLQKFGLSRETSPNIISRLEAYYAFNSSILSTFGSLDFKVLHFHLPSNLVNKIASECNKHILRKMNIFKNKEFEEVIQLVSLCMSPRVYLPGDYILYQNDVGEEMYFIVIGNVDIIAQNSEKVLKTLEKGEYFGELALIYDTKRNNSVVSKTLSLLYLLESKDFRRIIGDYPRALQQIVLESRSRRPGYHNDSRKAGKEENEEILKALNIFPANINPFFQKKPRQKQMTIIGGMENVNAELARDHFFQGNEHVEMHKRRPGFFIADERRFSQESLGKELVLSNFSKLKMKWTVEQMSN
jgi:voltage-gated potassium channel